MVALVLQIPEISSLSISMKKMQLLHLELPKAQSLVEQVQ
jgi:hypothetical protein